MTVVGGLTVTLGPLIGALLMVGLPALYGMGMAGQAALAVGWLLVVIFLPDGLGGILVARPRPCCTTRSPGARASTRCAPGTAWSRTTATARRRCTRRRTSRACSTGRPAPETARPTGPILTVDGAVAPLRRRGRRRPRRLRGRAGRDPRRDRPERRRQDDLLRDGRRLHQAGPRHGRLRRHRRHPGDARAARPRGPGAVLPGRRAVPDADRARDADGRPGARRADPAVEVRARRPHRRAGQGRRPPTRCSSGCG